jgi:hypothetical protein
LLAVDEEGYRMGQGGGFYDSSLAFRQRPRRYGKPLLVGWPMIASGWQQVPREAWDVQLDYLLTESGLHRRSVLTGFAQCLVIPVVAVAFAGNHHHGHENFRPR